MPAVKIADDAVEPVVFQFPAGAFAVSEPGIGDFVQNQPARVEGETEAAQIQAGRGHKVGYGGINLSPGFQLFSGQVHADQRISGDSVGSDSQGVGVENIFHGNVTRDEGVTYTAGGHNGYIHGMRVGVIGLAGRICKGICQQISEIVFCMGVIQIVRCGKCNIVLCQHLPACVPELRQIGGVHLFHEAVYFGLCVRVGRNIFRDGNQAVVIRRPAALCGPAHGESPQISSV